MKGLLLKDAYSLIKICGLNLILILLFIAISLLGKVANFFLLFPCIISGPIAVALISIDEKDKWDLFSATLPYSRGEIVSSKYLITLIINVIVIILILISNFAVTTINGTFSAQNFIKLILLLTLICIITPSVIYPFVFKFGAEKGRIFYSFIVGMIMGLGVTSIQFIIKVNLLTLLISIFLLALFYAISWILSIKIYKAKEF